MKSIFRVAVVCALLASPAVYADSAWVTDQFEITLRSGPSTSNAIELMLDSGTKLEILERDAESGYSRVRTNGGTEGYVLTRQLVDQPVARDRLAAAEAEVKALKAEGYRVVLVNSNPATIMTDPEMAARTYIEPVTAEAVSRIIKRERPDALLPTLGGQTSLNLAVELAEPFLQRHHMGHLLTGMGDGLHVDDRHIRVFREGVQDLVLAVFLPVHEFRESANADHVAIARQHLRRLFHMLFGVAVHDGAVLEFQGPHAARRRQHHRVPAQLIRPHIKGCAGSQAVVQEQKRNGLALQRIPMRGRLQGARLVEQRDVMHELVGGGADEIEVVLEVSSRRVCAHEHDATQQRRTSEAVEAVRSSRSTPAATRSASRSNMSRGRASPVTGLA